VRRWLLLISLAIAPRGASSAEDGRATLERYMRELRTMTVEFTQVLFDEQGTQVERAHGTAYIKRPGRFRWDYREPYRQSIIADGRKVWFYDVDLAQVTVSEIDPKSDTSPAALLGRDADLDARYEVVATATVDGRSNVQLKPRDRESQYQSIELAFDAKGLRNMYLADSFGQTVMIEFSEEQRDGTLADALFEFEVPEGADVVEAPTAPAPNPAPEK
jgi:outer membrane lipoprotein carrier protein